MHFIYSLLSDLTSNIYRISGLFIFLTIAFHIFFIFYRPLSLKNWKLVEYIWVMLAFISTLGLVDESRRINAITTLTHTQIKVETSKEKITDWFNSYQELTCNEQTHHLRCTTFTKIITDIELLTLENDIAPALNKNLLKPLSSLSPWLNDTSVNLVNNLINEYTLQRDQLLILEQQVKRSLFQKLINALTPLLLAFALALKMTKVTAEHLALKRKY